MGALHLPLEGRRMAQQYGRARSQLAMCCLSSSITWIPVKQLSWSELGINISVTIVQWPERRPPRRESRQRLACRKLLLLHRHLREGKIPEGVSGRRACNDRRRADSIRDRRWQLGTDLLPETTLE